MEYSRWSTGVLALLTSLLHFTHSEYLERGACNIDNKVNLQLLCDPDDVVIGSFKGGVFYEGRHNDTCVYHPEDCTMDLPLSHIDTNKCLWKENECNIEAGFRQLLVPQSCSHLSRSMWDYLWANYSCIPAQTVCDICNQTCIPTLPEGVGYILSPNYPNAYGDNLDCHSKTVTVDAGYGIYIKSDSMNLPTSNDGCGDTYVEIMPEYISGARSRHCEIFERHIPHNTVTLRFVAPSINTKAYEGFALHISSFPLPTTTSTTEQSLSANTTQHVSFETGAEEKEEEAIETISTKRYMLIFGVAGGALIVLVLIVALAVEIYKRQYTAKKSITQNMQNENFQEF